MSSQMTPSTRLDIEVEVLFDDVWWPGSLEHWRKAGDRWEGRLRWSTGVGQNRLGWFDQELLRRAEQ